MKRLLALAALLTLGATTPPNFTVLNTTVTDADTFAMVEIDKSAKASSYSTISVKTVDGTAKAGVDYQPVSRSQTVANNTTATRIPVPIIARPGYQGPRTFTLHLSVTRYGTVHVADATITINDSEPAPSAVTWTKCADEGQTCWVSGTANVRYGSGSTWVTQQVTNSVICSNSVFGDPTPFVLKGCYTDGKVGSPPPPPVITPSPVFGSWVSAPLTVGGFACSKWQAAAPKAGPCGSGTVYRIISVGMSSDAVPVQMYAVQFYQDASGNFPVGSAYATTVVTYWPGSDLIGIAPSVSVS